VVDGAGRLKGLITIRDIERAEAHPTAATDELGRLRIPTTTRHHRRPGRPNPA
jgi:IMP dehydrogenase